MEREDRVELYGILVGYRAQVEELKQHIRLLHSDDFTLRFDKDELRRTITQYEIQCTICEKRIEEIELELGDVIEE